jgi:hypothetical protein
MFGNVIGKTFVYVITAYYHGSHTGHSYVVGVNTNYDNAVEIAEQEEIHRNLEYVCEIVKILLDCTTLWDAKCECSIHRELGK